MKFLRYGPKGQEKPAVIDPEGNIRDLSRDIDDLTGAQLSPTNLSKLASIDLSLRPMIKTNVRIGPCVGNVGKFLCIGLNYHDHAMETGIPAPSEPIVFSKTNSCISGPNDDVLIPRHSNKTDWEAELGIIIGVQGKYITVDKSLDHIAGYCIVNDVSEREFQLEGTGQWLKGKSCDTFGPIGPWLVTKDEIPDPQNLAVWLEVDGKLHQDSHTSKMIFNVSEIVSYVSRFFTLYPGDIISTGTPAGVALGKKPHHPYLKDGQVMRLGITGLGQQQQKCVKEK